VRIAPPETPPETPLLSPIPRKQGDTTIVIAQINDRRPDMPSAERNSGYENETAASFVNLPGLQWTI